jgi:RNA 3'-terminal phosphate cyclase (ATP)
MIEIDGSRGGGQMLRTALTMSAITGDNFRITDIRGNRSNPGLKNQHLECVKAAARLCDAKLVGDEIGSEELEFKPGHLRNESFTSNIGTAGSITLLLDTVLPIATQFSEGFRIEVKGGSDVKWSPAASYFSEVKLELLRDLGLETDFQLKQTGYYPTGKGEARLEIKKSELQPIDITGRGELQRFEIFSKASDDLEEQNVADRQADELARKLKNSHISKEIRKNVEYVETDSNGGTLVLKAVYENTVAGFDNLGEQGKRSEKVADEVYKDFRGFHGSEATVDENMADQLMVFIALTGGEICVPEITPHIQTNNYVLEKFGRKLEISKGRQTFIYR